MMVRVDSASQVPRNLATIRQIIEKGDFSEPVKRRSIQIFENLAEVEGRIHNRPPSEVHFHEVGAVDSIIDIAGTVFGLDYLKIHNLTASPLPLGSGFVETAHGRIPIPAPATLALLRGVPVFDAGIPHEMVTPTGAALVKTLAHSFGPMPPMVPETTGYGVGKRTLPDRPNLLRIVIGEKGFNANLETVVVLDANIDDTNPEWLGFLMERLFEAGALDVVYCPVQMKKNRPAIQVQVMGHPEQRDTLMEVLFRESTTLGVRFQLTQRRALRRESAEVDSPWGRIKVKKVTGPDGTSRFHPEYEVCREIALKENRPLRDIFYWVMGLNQGT
jgi:uncharacterized protein (TIGR00299 family) protein